MSILSANSHVFFPQLKEAVAGERKWAGQSSQLKGRVLGGHPDGLQLPHGPAAHRFLLSGILYHFGSEDDFKMKMFD